jgi:hypothetical protein
MNTMVLPYLHLEDKCSGFYDVGQDESLSQETEKEKKG